MKTWRTARTRLAAIGAMLLCLATAVEVPARGTAGDAEEIHDAATATESASQRGSGLLQLVEQSPFLTDEDEFVLRVRTVGAPSTGRLHVTVHDRVRTRSGFLRSIEGRGLGRELGPGTAPQPVTAEPVLRVPLVPEQGGVRLAGPGVYPVVIELRNEDGTRLARLITHLVRLSDAVDRSKALQVALVLPMNTELAHRPDGTIRVDDEARVALAASASVLARYVRMPLALRPSPESLDALAGDGPADGEGGLPEGRALISAVRQALSGREVVGSTYVPVDLPTWLGPDLEGELEAALATGQAALKHHLALAPDRDTWIADGRTDDQSLEWLEARGVKRLVLPPSAMVPLNERLFPATLTRTFGLEGASGIEAAVADEALVRHIGESGDPILDAQRILTDLAILHLDQPVGARGVVALLPPTGELPATLLDALLAGLDDNPVLNPVTLSDFFDEVSSASSRGQGTGRGPTLRRQLASVDAVDLGDFPASVQRARDELSTYRTLVGPDAKHVDLLASRLLIASAKPLSSSQRLAFVQGVSDAVRAETAKIEVPDRQAITLTARRGRIPLTFRNTATYPMNVVVRLQADRLQFPDHPTRLIDLRLEKGFTRVELPVRAPSSGDAPLDVIVRSPDGRLELGHTRITIRSTAFSGVGLVLSIGAGLFLVAWWGRSVHRSISARRRAKHAIRLT